MNFKNAITHYSFALFFLLAVSQCKKDEQEFALAVTVFPSEAGSVEPAGGVFQKGKTIELIAEPNYGWYFDRWELDVDTTVNPFALRMNRNYNIVAVFERRMFPLNVTIDGDGIVREKVIRAKQIEFNQPYQTVVQLTAENIKGWNFSHWSGDVESDNPIITVTVENEVNLTAHFDVEYYPLLIHIVGKGKVHNDYGRNDSIPFNTRILLTPEPDPKWAHYGWSGDVSGLQGSKTILFRNPMSVTAEFTPAVKYGGRGYDLAHNMISLRDGGFAFLANTYSENQNFAPFGSSMAGTVILRLDEGMSLSSVIPIDLSGSFSGSSLQQLNDGNWMLIGEREVTVGREMVIAKLDVLGNVIWERTWKNGGLMSPTSLMERPDGGFLIVGIYDGGTDDFQSIRSDGQSFFMLRTDSEGHQQWLKSYNRSENDFGGFMQPVSSGGFLLALNHQANDREYFSLTRITENGEIGASTIPVFEHTTHSGPLLALEDGGFLIGASTYQTSETGPLMSLINVDANGTVRWSKTYPADGGSLIGHIQRCPDGSLLISGRSNSNSGIFAGLNRGGFDVFLMKVDALGEMRWIRMFGGSGYESLTSVVIKANGDILLSGNTSSTDFFFKQAVGTQNNMFLIQLDSDGHY